MTMPENFASGLIASTAFGLLGILLLLFGFKLFDWILPKVEFQDLMKADPLGAAIIIASFFLAVAHIIAAVVH